MKKLVLIVFLILCSKAVFAQTPCQTDPIYNQFDFWVGKWKVFNTSGNISGYSKISKILDNCVILEEWESAISPKNFVYTGKSYNTYDSTTKQWQEYWIDNNGKSTAYLTGYYKNDAMHFMTAAFDNNGKKSIRKLTFYKLKNNYVRQLFEISSDDGKTWATETDLEYRPDN